MLCLKEIPIDKTKVKKFSQTNNTHRVLNNDLMTKLQFNNTISSKVYFHLYVSYS